MANKEFTFSLAQILTPAYPSPLNRLSPSAFGASLTLTKGQALARKTSDGKLYPLNLAATDGTQTFAGFNRQACGTDSSGNVYLIYSGTAGATVYTPAFNYGDIYTGGIFDPNDLVTSATGTPAQEVDTLTPTNPTTGDVYTIGLANGAVASFIVGATQTATATVTGLAAAWNANPVLKALATTSGTATLILTAVAFGSPLKLQAGVSGTGTTALVITTPATDSQQSEVDTFTPGGSITTGDVYTLTVTLPNTSTIPISFTVGATATATAVCNGLRTAWNANATAAALAVASGTATLILTASQIGGSLSITGAVVGVGTVSKATTKPALGRDITHILAGCPGARVLQTTGFWEVP